MATQKSVTITTSATKILDANSKRVSVFMVNNGTETIFIGDDSDVTSSNGLPIYVGNGFTEDRGMREYLGPIYGITSANTSDMRVWERSSSI